MIETTVESLAVARAAYIYLVAMVSAYEATRWPVAARASAAPDDQQLVISKEDQPGVGPRPARPSNLVQLRAPVGRGLESGTRWAMNLYQARRGSRDDVGVSVIGVGSGIGVEHILMESPAGADLDAVGAGPCTDRGGVRADRSGERLRCGLTRRRFDAGGVPQGVAGCRVLGSTRTSRESAGCRCCSSIAYTSGCTTRMPRSRALAAFVPSTAPSVTSIALLAETAPNTRTPSSSERFSSRSRCCSSQPVKTTLSPTRSGSPCGHGSGKGPRFALSRVCRACSACSADPAPPCR